MTSVAEIGRQQHETWDAPATTVVRVALAGCGAVGSALIREIVSRRDALAERHGVEIVLTSVLVRDVARRRDATFDASLLTNNVDAFLAARADVVIEAIGGFDPALRIAQTVLGRGQSLITANKLLLASHGSSLASLARRNGTTLRYDAAVGGGVPVLRVLDDALAAGGVSRVRGILNGTANFVLTRLEEGESLDGALGAARDAGFAEADASRDLDGRDAADKLALIAWAAFGVAPEALPVRRTSLLPDPARYVNLAERLGASVRHVAECEIGPDGVVASVEPVLVPTASSLGRTRDEGNHVDVFAGWRSPLCASGPGAGGVPTATALLSDLVCTGVAPRRHERTRIAARDARTFAWALEVCAEPTVLHRHVPKCGLVRTSADATASWTIVDDATADDVAIIVEQLTQCGASPIVARVDGAGVARGECWS